MPPVSVIVATRNRPDLLRRTIAGVQAQNYDGDIECIVVFDQAQPDPTLASAGTAVNGFHRTVRTICNDHSSGLAGARNSGVKHSESDLIAFCDDDDIWLESKLAMQVGAMTTESTDTCVTGITVRYRACLTERIPSAEEMTVHSLVRHRVMAAHPSTVLVRRPAFLASIGPVDEQIPGGFAEDYDWIIRAASHGRISVVPEPLVMVRWGSHSFFNRDWETIIEALDYMVNKHPEFRSDPASLARIRGQQAFALAALGDGPAARRSALTTIRLTPREKRAYLALVAATPGFRPEWILRFAHRFGRGL